jgi:hypothetical protein
MTGCKGRFFVSGKKNIIWYKVHGKHRTLHLPYSRANRRIAGDKIRYEENSELYAPPAWEYPMYIEDCIDEWGKIIKSTRSKSTRYKYVLALNFLTDNFALNDVDGIRENIRKNFESSQLLPISKNSYLSKLRAFFNYLLRRGWIVRNPILPEMFVKTTEKPIEIYSESELRSILDYWRQRDFEFYLFIEFIYRTAFRFNEALQLRWEQCLLDNKFRNAIILTSKDKKKTEEFPQTFEGALGSTEVENDEGEVRVCRTVDASDGLWILPSHAVLSDMLKDLADGIKVKLVYAGLVGPVSKKYKKATAHWDGEVLD